MWSRRLRSPLGGVKTLLDKNVPPLRDTPPIPSSPPLRVFNYVEGGGTSKVTLSTVDWRSRGTILGLLVSWVMPCAHLGPACPVGNGSWGPRLVGLLVGLGRTLALTQGPTLQTLLEGHLIPRDPLWQALPSQTLSSL